MPFLVFSYKGVGRRWFSFQKSHIEGRRCSVCFFVKFTYRGLLLAFNFNKIKWPTVCGGLPKCFPSIDDQLKFLPLKYLLKISIQGRLSESLKVVSAYLRSETGYLGHRSSINL